MKTDVVVLGAGIVGTSIAVHLALRGRAVALVDRRAPGEETSHGNSGLVERSSLYPIAFPRKIGALLGVALKRYPGTNYHLSALPGLAAWLQSYWRASAPERLEATARIMHPILATTVDEHRALARLAGAERIISIDRLLLKDIEACSRNSLLPQYTGQSCLIDDRPSGHVDQKCGRLHAGQSLGI